MARLAAPAPTPVILDEPTAALDVSVQPVALNLLHDLKQSIGMSYLFVSHDLNVVRLLCDTADGDPHPPLPAWLSCSAFAGDDETGRER
jgi:ABC-type glutathione transport system ATPase component